MLPHYNRQGNGYEQGRSGFDTYQLKLSRIEGCYYVIVSLGLFPRSK